MKNGNFNPKRIALVVLEKSGKKMNIAEIGKELGVTPPTAYKWISESPVLLDKIHDFCKKHNVTFEELYKKIG